MPHHASGQKKGSCGHVMAIFDSHLKCAHCHEKGEETDSCVSGEESSPAFIVLTPGQKIQLSVPSYNQGKEKEK